MECNPDVSGHIILFLLCVDIVCIQAQRVWCESLAKFTGTENNNSNVTVLETSKSIKSLSVNEIFWLESTRTFSRKIAKSINKHLLQETGSLQNANYYLISRYANILFKKKWMKHTNQSIPLSAISSVCASCVLLSIQMSFNRMIKLLTADLNCVTILV